MAKKSETAPATLRIKLTKSPIGYSKKHKAMIRTLGLRKMNQVVQHPDTPSVRGILLYVNHLVTIEEVES